MHLGILFTINEMNVKLGTGDRGIEDCPRLDDCATINDRSSDISRI